MIRTKDLLGVLKWGCLIGLFSCATPVESASTQSMEVRPLSIDLPRDPSLVLKSAFEVDWKGSQFRGLSGLLVSEDGHSFIALSDGGYLAQGHFTMNAEGIPMGVSPQNLKISPLVGLNGRSLPWARRNSEGITKYTRCPSGEGISSKFPCFLISFEGNRPEIRSYGILEGGTLKAFEDIPQPTFPPKVDPNQGLEGIRQLPSGGLMTFLEFPLASSPNVYSGWIKPSSSSGAEEKWKKISLRTDGNFGLTDFNVLPNGDLLVLERSFSLLMGWGMRLTQVPHDHWEDISSPLEGKTILEFHSFSQIDNMEGLEIRPSPRGKEWVSLYLVSDDNYNRFEKTMFMVFEMRTQ